MKIDKNVEGWRDDVLVDMAKSLRDIAATLHRMAAKMPTSPAKVIPITGPLTKEQVNSVREQWETHYSGANGK